MHHHRLSTAVGKAHQVDNSVSLCCLLTGLADLTEVFVKRFEQQAGAAALQVKQAAQAGNHAHFQAAVQLAHRFQHLSGSPICTS